MFVIATAGHVDHGKSALVRALTGEEPDRWAEERRRGLTIDLGFAATELPSGRSVSFVDVPGHERFLGNMLAGLGPAPVVCFVVAADEGWQAQSSDHRDAIAALGIEHGLVVLTKADRVGAGTPTGDERIERVLERVRAELAGTGLAHARAVAVSAHTGAGLAELRAALDDVLAEVPAADPTARTRAWLDRAFTVAGAGTVVTTTLAAGTVHRGQRLGLVHGGRETDVAVRSVQSHHRTVERAEPVQRVAVNLRGTATEDVSRGDVLVSPGAWPLTAMIDVRRSTGEAFATAGRELTVHVGTAAIPATVRPFDAEHARLTLATALPLVPGDRLVLRRPGTPAPLGGAVVLDADPAPLTRRGDGARHRDWLADLPSAGDARAETVRRGAMRVEQLERLGLLPWRPVADSAVHSTVSAADRGIEATGDRGPGGSGPAGSDGTVPRDVVVAAGWWVHREALARWSKKLRRAVERVHARDPLAHGLSRGAAVAATGIPDAALLPLVVRAAGVVERHGVVADPQREAQLGAAEDAVRRLEDRLRAHPFEAPEAHELAELGLGDRELAAAERLGRIVRLPGGVVLLPTAPALAMRELVALEQPFTASAARRAWNTTRRVAIPLLEHLDARGWTRRVDGTLRETVAALDWGRERHE